MAEEKEKHKIFTINVRGIPFPGPPFHPEILEEVLNFEPEPSDIFVVTYPKCGTTWMQYIVWEIVNKGIPPPTPNKMIFGEFPFLELTGLDVLKGSLPPRLMKTHLPFQLQPFNPSSKYVYVARNPFDCCVSYYHHTKGAAGSHPDLTFDDFFEFFVEGKAPYGDYFDHVLSWYTHRNDPNILFLTYEDLKKDPKAEIMNIARFLGDSYFNVLQNDPQVLANCLKHTSFKYMKDLGMFFAKKLSPQEGVTGLKDKQDMKTIVKSMGNVNRTNVDLKKYEEWEFFRKGIVGDWKNHFTAAQKRRFNEYMVRKLRGTEMEGFWSAFEDDDAARPE